MQDVLGFLPGPLMAPSHSLSQSAPLTLTQPFGLHSQLSFFSFYTVSKVGLFLPRDSCYVLTTPKFTILNDFSSDLQTHAIAFKTCLHSICQNINTPLSSCQSYSSDIILYVPTIHQLSKQETRVIHCSSTSNSYSNLHYMSGKVLRDLVHYVFPAPSLHFPS